MIMKLWRTSPQLIFIGKSGKDVICYVNTHVVDFFLQEDNQKVCDSNVHSRQLGKASQASRLQPSCGQDVQSGSHTNTDVSHLSQTQLSSASNCVISNGIKEEKQHYSPCEKQSAELFNHQEREVTVDILAECVSSCQQ